MHIDFLIIGQGLCGTFLSWYLQKAGKSFVVIDNNDPTTASRVAAGIINPVTGRRIVKTWLIDELLPFSKAAYLQLGNELNIDCIEQKNTIDFFPSVQMRQAFIDRSFDDPQNLLFDSDANNWKDHFNYDLGYGEIQPCFLVKLHSLLPCYRKHLSENQQLLEEHFNIEKLIVGIDKIHYKDITASSIVFCDGFASYYNHWFMNLPFAPNKGEVLLIESSDLPKNRIFKRGIHLVYLKEHIYWTGSSYQWVFENDQPTQIFRERTLSVLKDWLRVPFKVVDHLASIRAATVERRPFIGFHPVHKSIAIFNGMGTKGCSLAPYFAQQLVQHITNGTPLHREVNVERFKNLLTRNAKN